MGRSSDDSATIGAPSRALLSSGQVHALAGLSAGLSAGLFFHPVDVLKTRYQAQDHRAAVRYRSVLHAIRHIYQTEGLRAFVQGLSPNLVAQCASWGSYFYIYNELKTVARGYSDSGDLGTGAHLLCATGGGAVTVFLTNPLWVVKTRMQLQPLQSPNRYRGLRDGLSTIHREEGVRGLYRGLTPALFGVSHGAVQFAVYEEARTMVLGPGSGRTDMTVLESFFTGAIAKVTASIVTYPYQVIKSRLQARDSPYKGVADVCRAAWKHEGIGGFYRGLVPNLIKVTPSAALTFAAYELVRARLAPFAAPQPN